MSLRPVYTGIAKRVYDDIMALPEEAVAPYIAIVVGGAFAADVTEHAPVVQAKVDQIVAERVAEVRKALARTTVSKAAAGEDLATMAATAGYIAKAYGAADADAEQHRAWARSQARDASGRFRVMHRTISTTKQWPLKDRHAAALGIPAHKNGMSNAEKSAYQQAFEQVRDLALHAPGLGRDSLVTLRYRNHDGSLDQQTFLASDLTKTGEDNALRHFAHAGRITDATLEVPTDITAAHAAFDLAGALGAGPEVAGRAGAAFGTYVGDDGRQHYKTLEPTRNFARKWTEASSSPDEPHRHIYRRIGAGAKLLNAVLGPLAPPKVKAALEAANWAALHGPEAEKVIGPHADRAAYRYRGVERTPEPGLQKTVDALRTRLKDPDAARHALIYGEDVVVPRRSGGIGAVGRGAQGGKLTGVEVEHRPSPVISYFQRPEHLGDPDLVDLQLKSGVTKPSEGVIIDRGGKVVTQSVGYGDDHYLPFNLKNLGRLAGGEYIRTRTWGGPTTEDIYTGLVSGARAITVVSHNGVYTVEFDDTFRGSRRYNDKAARMVKRYGHLLDAVQSRQVTPPIPPDRYRELVAESKQYASPARRAQALEDLVAAEGQNPQMSAAARREVAESVLNAHAERIVTADGSYKDWKHLAAAYVEGKQAEALAFNARAAASPGYYDPASGEIRQNTPVDVEEITRQAAASVATPEQAVKTLGFGEEYGTALEHAEADYRNAHSPMALNGEGYYKALQALQEQFPYYLKVTYQPTQRGGRSDPGYVKPKYNRPAAAKAGYFDASINGWGSRPADQTRFQNYANRKHAEDRADESSLREPTAQTRMAAAAARPAAPPADHTGAQRAALGELYDAVRGAKIADRPGNSGVGQVIQPQVALSAGVAPSFFGADRATFLANYDKAPDKAAFVDSLLAEAKAAHGDSLEIANLEKLAATAADPAAASRPVPFSIEAALSSIDQPWDLVPAGLSPDEYEDYLIDARKPLLLPEGVQMTPEQLVAAHAELRDQLTRLSAFNDIGRVEAESVLKALATAHRALTLKAKAQKDAALAVPGKAEGGLEDIASVLRDKGYQNALFVQMDENALHPKVIRGETA